MRRVLGWLVIGVFLTVGVGLARGSGEAVATAATPGGATGSFGAQWLGTPAGGVTPLEVVRLTATVPQDEAEFGMSVGVSGDLVVVAADREDGGPSGEWEDSGAVYIFRRNSGGVENWALEIRLTDPVPQENKSFGRSVAIRGDTVVVGAMQRQPEGHYFGVVYVFERHEGGVDNWGLAAKLNPSRRQGGLFGYGVATTGDRILVSAPTEFGGEGNGMINVGAAYIFERNHGGAGNWGEVARLTTTVEFEWQRLGISLALDGDTVLLSTSDHDAGGNRGSAHLFERNQGGPDQWGEVRTLEPSGDERSGSYGRALAVHGDTAVVGDPGWASPSNPTSPYGAVHVFERHLGGGNQWGQAARVQASQPVSSSEFGGSVALSPNLLLVGAHDERFSSRYPGAVHFFSRHMASHPWTPTGWMTASDWHSNMRYGTVALDGRTAIVGAHLGEAVPGYLADQTGTAYVICLDDAAEENDDPATAAPLPITQHAGYHRCPGDDDTFAVALEVDQMLDVSALFSHAEGDLDLTLLDPSGTPVAQSSTGSGHERIVYQAVTAGTHTLVVTGGAQVENSYTLRVDQVPGVSRTFVPLARLQLSP